MIEFILEHRTIVSLLVFLLFNQILAAYRYKFEPSAETTYFSISLDTLCFWPNIVFIKKVRLLLAVLFIAYTAMFLWFFWDYYFLMSTWHMLASYLIICIIWFLIDIIACALISKWSETQFDS